MGSKGPGSGPYVPSELPTVVARDTAEPPSDPSRERGVLIPPHLREPAAAPERATTSQSTGETNRSASKASTSKATHASSKGVKAKMARTERRSVSENGAKRRRRQQSRAGKVQRQRRLSFTLVSALVGGATVMSTVRLIGKLIDKGRGKGFERKGTDAQGGEDEKKIGDSAKVEGSGEAFSRSQATGIGAQGGNQAEGERGGVASYDGLTAARAEASAPPHPTPLLKGSTW